MQFELHSDGTLEGTGFFEADGDALLNTMKWQSSAHDADGIRLLNFSMRKPELSLMIMADASGTIRNIVLYFDEQGDAAIPPEYKNPKLRPRPL